MEYKWKEYSVMRNQPAPESNEWAELDDMIKRLLWKHSGKDVSEALHERASKIKPYDDTIGNVHSTP
jgi:hypothetical protein